MPLQFALLWHIVIFIFILLANLLFVKPTNQIGIIKYLKYTLSE